MPVEKTGVIYRSHHIFGTGIRSTTVEATGSWSDAKDNLSQVVGEAHGSHINPSDVAKFIGGNPNGNDAKFTVTVVDVMIAGIVVHSEVIPYVENAPIKVDQKQLRGRSFKSAGPFKYRG